MAFSDLGIQCKDPSSVAGFMEWLGASKYPRITKKTLSSKEKNQFVNVCYPLYVQRDNCWYDRTEFSNITSVTVGFFENLEIILEHAKFNDILAWFLLDEEIRSRIYCETEEKNTFSCILGWPGKKVDQRKVSPGYIKSFLLYYLATVKWVPNEKGIKENSSHCCFEDNDLDPFIVVPSVDYSYLKNIKKIILHMMILLQMAMFWQKETELKEKMQSFKSRYQAYLYEDLKGDEQCVQLYDQYLEDYVFLEPTIENTISIDIEAVFENETGVTFAVLEEYSPSTIESYLIFGKILELTRSDEPANGTEAVPNERKKQEDGFQVMQKRRSIS